MRQKRVPQVRARKDNECGYRGSPGLVKMVLMCVLTHDLAIGFVLLICSSGKSVDRYVKIGRPIFEFALGQTKAWVSVDRNPYIGRPTVHFTVAICSRVGVSVDRSPVSVDRSPVSVDRFWHCSMP